MKPRNSATLALLDAARAAHGNCTDYRISRLLNVSTCYLTNWRHGQHLSDEYALRLADLAGLDPVPALLAVAAERASPEAAAVYGQALDLLRPLSKPRIGPKRVERIPSRQPKEESAS